MAEKTRYDELKKEATCPICMELFKDPVMINCGHNFCRACITRCWQESNGFGSWGGAFRETLEDSYDYFKCPHCRKESQGKNTRANFQLKNIVETLKQLHPADLIPQAGNQCPTHQEKLKLFCKEDQQMMCLVCRESKDHASHSARPIEEAAQLFKVRLQDWLSPLKKEVEVLEESKLNEQKKRKVLTDKFDAENSKIEAEVQRLLILLKEQREKLRLKLEVDKKAIQEATLPIDQVSNEITSIKALMMEIEKKCEGQAWELIKDFKDIQTRCSSLKLHKPEQEMKNEVKNDKGKGRSAKRAKIEKTEVDIKNYKVVVTLDPDTANSMLLLSEGNKRVKRADKPQPLPPNSKRFGFYPCVLGSEGFTTGKHYWEVQLLQEGGGWHVGVAAQSVCREQSFICSPKAGVWAVRGSDGEYWALTDDRITLTLRDKLKKIGVYLDYEGKKLSLYNADTMELIYTFAEAAFTNEIYPFFRLFRAEMELIY